MNKIIGLCGFKGSGKTEVAKYLKEQGYIHINFKDALVQELKDGFPDLLESLSAHYDMSINELFKRKPMLVRRLMQNFGTNVRRKQNLLYWVEKWVLEARHHFGHNIVVDDVRFINEDKVLRDTAEALGYEFKVIKIERNGYNGDNHISEQEMREITPTDTIKNNGTIKELINEVKKLI